MNLRLGVSLFPRLYSQGEVNVIDFWISAYILQIIDRVRIIYIHRYSAYMQIIRF